jgi:hypothetical protein
MMMMPNANANEVQVCGHSSDAKEIFFNNKCHFACG